MSTTRQFAITVDGLPLEINTARQFNQFKANLLEYLQMVPASEDGVRLYIGGEGDSNQSNFERLSNNLKIGVLAPSCKVGYTLLSLLRVIIDYNIDYLVGTIHRHHEYCCKLPGGQRDKRQNMSMRDLVDIMYNIEMDSSTVSEFGLTDKIQRVRNSTKVTETTIDQVDIWTISRFVEYVYRGKPITIKVKDRSDPNTSQDGPDLGTSQDVSDPSTSQDGPAADSDVLTKRLTKADFPGEYYVQDGEIFNDDIKWGTEWIKMNITWDDSFNGADEPGLLSEFGEYAGWDSKNHAYLRYNSSLHENEHCIRIRKE